MDEQAFQTKFRELLQRIQQSLSDTPHPARPEESITPITEILLATNPNLEGEATAEPQPHAGRGLQHLRTKGSFR